MHPGSAAHPYPTNDLPHRIAGQVSDPEPMLRIHSDRVSHTRSEPHLGTELRLPHGPDAARDSRQVLDPGTLKIIARQMVVEPVGVSATVSRSTMA